MAAYLTGSHFSVNGNFLKNKFLAIIVINVNKLCSLF